MKKIYLNVLLVLLLVAPAFAQGKPPCAVEVAQMLAAEKSGNYASIIQKATECIRLNPAAADAYHQRGMAYLAQVEKNYLLKENYDLALADFEKALGIDPKKGDSYLKRIVIRQRKMGSGFLATLPEYNKAIEYLTASKDTATLAEAYKERAFVYALERQSDLAIADYNTALKIRPDYAAALLLRATTYKLKEDYDAALADYNQLLKIKPGESVYSGRGEIYEQKGELEKALADYRAALALNSNNGYLKDKVAKGPGGWMKRLDQKTINAAYQCATAAIQLSTDAISTKNYAPVIQKATECIGINSESSVPYLIRAKAYGDKGDFDLAIADFNKAIALEIKEIAEFRKLVGDDHPNVKQQTESLIESYGQRSDVYLKKGETEKARADLNAALAVDPKNFAIKDKLATLDKRAKELSDKARLLNPKTGDDYVAVGRENYKQRKYDQAVAAYTQAVQLDPKNAAAYAGRGDAFRQLKNYDSAFISYNKAIEIRPQYESHLGRGLIYFDKGGHDAAVADFTQAFKLAANDKPAAVTALMRRGETYQLQNKYDLAVADFTQGLQLAIGDKLSTATALTGRGNAYRLQNKLDLALADFNQAIEVASSDYITRIVQAPEIYLGRGRLYLATGKNDSAIADFRKTLELNPEYAAAKTELAKLDGKPAGVPNAPASTTSVPQTAEQFAALGRRQAGQKNYEEAVKSFTGCILLKADADACYTFRGSVYGLTGKMDLATADFDRAIKLNPNTAAVYFIRGMMFMQLRKTEQAIADFRAGLKIDPNNQQAKQALQQLGAQP